MRSTGPHLDVDLDALLRNAVAYGARVGVPLLPMVKADGYGLGAVPVARALEPLGPFGFGVASAAEAGPLRQAGIARPIVAFQPMMPSEMDLFFRHEVRPVIGSLEAFDAWTGRSDRPFHVEIDAGMGRSGFRWHDRDRIGGLADRLRQAAGFEGLFTHFSTAEDPTLTGAEWDRFQAVVRALPVRPRFIHAANSAAAQWGRYAADLARPGIFLYGGRAGDLVPEPVASLRGVVHAVRPIRAGDPVSYGGTRRANRDAEVVTIGLGYADGVLRSLSNGGEVWVRGRLLPIAGRVTMDMTMVIADSGIVQIGDIATFFGAEPNLDRQAERAGTISYELLTSVGRRVTRDYGAHR